MVRYQGNPNVPFWKTLKQGYDFFEKYRLPPTVAVCEKRYVVNVKMPANSSVRPDGTCPRFQRPVFEPFTPKPFEQQIAEERITVPGPKTRQFATAATPAFAQSYGLGAPVVTGSTDVSAPAPMPAVGFAQ
jgi:hypothetical protein